MSMRARSPRFKLSEPPGFRLQPDDIAMLWHIYCNRIIDAQSLYALFPDRSDQVLSRRLNLLRKGKAPYIQRIAPPSLRAELQTGSEPFLYALANEGAKILNTERDLSIPTNRWLSRNNALKRNTLTHEVTASRFLARMARDAQSLKDVTFRYLQEFDEGEFHAPKAGIGKPNTLKTRIANWHGYRGQEATAPDRIFSVTAGSRVQYLFLELDMGTETIAPSEALQRSPAFWHRTSILRKLIVYTSAFETKAHTKEFNLPVFRVIVVTTSPARAANMAAACDKYLPHIPPGLFLFTDWVSLEKTGNLLVGEFATTRGEGRSIVPSVGG